MNARTRILTMIAATVMLPLSLHAQSVTLTGSAGAAVPIGDYADGVNTGWMANAALLVGLPSAPRLSLGVRGLYSSNGVKDADVNATQTGFFGTAVYRLSAPDKAGFAVGANVGMMKGKVDDVSGDNELSYGVSLAYVVPMTKFSVFGAVAYYSAFDSEVKNAIMPLSVGLSIPIKK